MVEPDTGIVLIIVIAMFLGFLIGANWAAQRAYERGMENLEESVKRGRDVKS